MLLLLSGIAASTAPDLRTRYFEFYFRGTRASAHERLVRRADQVARRVTAALGTHWPAPTRVIVAGSLSDFRAALPAGVELPRRTVGVAFWAENLIVVRNHPDIQRTFVHEASHIALRAAVPRGHLPRWFVEGFAAYQAGEGSFGRLASLVRASVSGTVIPLRDLEARFPSREGATDLAYAQSSEFVAYLLGTYGRHPFRRFLARLVGGEPFFRALSAAYGKSVDELEEGYLRDLRVRYNWVPIVAGPAVLWIGITLVFLLAYVRKRRETRRRLEAMADADVEADPLPPGTEPPDPGSPPPPPTLH